MRLASSRTVALSILRQVRNPACFQGQTSFSIGCGCQRVSSPDLRTSILHSSEFGGQSVLSVNWRHLSTDQDSPVPSGKVEGKSRVRNFDQVVYRLQADVRRRRRIHKAEIHNAVELFETAPQLENFGDFLLDCCCDVLPDLEPSYRVNLALRIWSVIEKSKEFTPVYFEAMLKAIAINEDKRLDPWKYLNQAKSAGIPVTATMYYFAMLIACQRGDLEGAVKVLDDMKSNGVPVNERFFNALIIGNFRSGDYKGALDILGIMKASHIEPSSHTWSTLLKIHIEKGDLEGLSKTYSNMGGLQLSEDLFHELLKTAGMQENEEITKTVIQWALDSNKMQILTVNNLIRQLTHSGHVDGAAMMLLRFESVLKAKQEPFGSFFIKDLYSADVHTNPEKYLNLVATLQSLKRNPFAFNIAAESCLKHNQFNLAFSLFDKMVSTGVPLRPHYFLPAFVFHTEEYGTKGAVAVLKQMKSLNVPPNWDLLVEWILPTVFHLERNLLETLKIVKEASDLSYSSGGLVSAGLIVALREGQVKEGLAVVENIPAKLTNPKLIMEAIMQYICDLEMPTDLQAILKYVKYLQDNRGSQDLQDYLGQLLVKLVECDRTEETETILKENSYHKIPVSQGAHQILTNLKLNLENLEVDDKLYLQQSRTAAMDSVQSLECHQEELTSKGMNDRGNLRKLFLKYCSAGDVEKAKECSKIFEAEHGSLSQGMKSALMGVHIKAGELQESLTLFLELTSQDSDVVVDIYKIVDLGTLLAQNGRVEEAVQLIQDMCPSRRIQKPEAISRNIVNLLEAVSKGQDASSDYVAELTELFLKTRLMLPKNPVLAPSIRDLIRKNDLVGAVKRLELYCREYKQCPCLQELTYKVLNDSELLARVVKCSIAVKGEREAKRWLGLAKADVGDVDGAARCFTELGTALSFASMINQVEYLMSRNEVDKVLNLITAIQKTGLKYDCTKLYETAIQACKRLGNTEGMKKLISSMEDQDLYVSPKLKEMSSQS